MKLVLLQLTALICKLLLVKHLRITYVGEISVLTDLFLELLNLHLLDILSYLLCKKLSQLIANVVLLSKGLR